MCFSLAWLVQLIVWLIIVCAIDPVKLSALAIPLVVASGSAPR